MQQADEQARMADADASRHTTGTSPEDGLAGTNGALKAGAIAGRPAAAGSVSDGTAPSDGTAASGETVPVNGARLAGVGVLVPSVLPEHYGRYGGRYIPDPYCPALDQLAEQALAVLASDAWRQAQARALATAGRQAPRLDRHGIDLIIDVDIETLLLAGFLALAACLGRRFAIGATSARSALQALDVAAELELDGHLVLAAGAAASCPASALRGSASVSVDPSSCAELFDDPNLYAFQRFVAAPDATLFVPLDANCGAYPYPGLTALLASAVAGEIAATIGDSAPSVLVPQYPGRLAAGLLAVDWRGLASHGERAPTREDCYCGALTVVLGSGTSERVLAPAIVDAWARGALARVDRPDLAATQPSSATQAPSATEATPATPATEAPLPTEPAIIVRDIV